jgi:hypothetical protein
VVANFDRTLLRERKLQAKVDDILSAVKRDDIGYIQSVYLGYADDGMPPITLDREVED